MVGIFTRETFTVGCCNTKEEKDGMVKPYLISQQRYLNNSKG
jgi:hypothetical protein